MRRLNQDSCAVTGVRLATASAAMIQIQENLNPLPDNGVGFLPFDICDESNPASFMLELRIVQTLLRREASEGPRALGDFFIDSALHYFGDFHLHADSN